MQQVNKLFCLDHQLWLCTRYRLGNLLLNLPIWTPFPLGYPVNIPILEVGQQDVLTHVIFSNTI